MQREFLILIKYNKIPYLITIQLMHNTCIHKFVFCFNVRLLIRQNRLCSYREAEKQF